MKKIIHFISLGCDKNLTDSEKMLGILQDKYDITDDEKKADIIIVNTCCFIHDAKEESIETILEMSRYKTEGCLKALVVTGCLAERYKKEIIAEIPEVDSVIGTTAIDEIEKAIDIAIKNNICSDSNNYIDNNYFKDINYLPKMQPDKRIITTGGYTSYLKISEGCDKFCTYCIIPKLRGKHRSVPMEDLLLETKYLASQGIKELIVVGQETTLYGLDIYGKKMLPELLSKLCEIEGIEWIRLLYCYPEEITDELISTIKIQDKICKYIDMPIQHASDSVLKRMGRKTSKKDLIDIITKIRDEIPDIVLRTTLITGFPQETDEEFEELINFVYDMNFERLGAFTFSAEEGTPAAIMGNQVEEEVKIARKDAIMELQQDIVFDMNQDMIGRIFDVIIEGYISEDDIYVGRTYMDAPNIDGLIFVECKRMLMSGEIIQAEVTQADGYDLIAKTIY